MVRNVARNNASMIGTRDTLLRLEGVLQIRKDNGTLNIRRVRDIDNVSTGRIREMIVALKKAGQVLPSTPLLDLVLKNANGGKHLNGVSVGKLREAAFVETISR